MTLRININKILIFILALSLTTFATAGSMYIFFRGYAKMIFIALILATMLIFALGKPLKANLYIFFLIAMTGIYFINNNSYHNIRALPVLLLFPTMIAFVFFATYINEIWMVYTFNIMKIVYVFYIAYTIVMFFSPRLLYVILGIFPGSAPTILWQYSQGCMPGFTNHYSTNGMLIVISLLIFGTFAIHKKNLLNYALFAVSLIALLLTGKRAHILFGLASLFIAYYIYSADKKRSRGLKALAIALAAVLAMVLIFYYVPQLAVFVNRFLESSMGGDVTLGRTAIWEEAIGIFSQNPFLGIGWLKFITIFHKKWHVHNIYIQLLCETGIIGFTVYFSAFVYFLIGTGKRLAQVSINKETHSKDERLYLMLSLAIQVFFLLYGFTGNPLYDKEMFVPYFMSCAIYTSYRFKRW
ncbi:MAG: O-antigen ligase family protein [Suipraeoptans sp.]